MVVRTDGPAPYAPPATVLSVIDRYRSHGLQTPFTKDVLNRAGVTESLVPRTLQALRLLDLIDGEANPTTQLEGLGRAGHDELQGLLADVVRAAYADVFRFANPAQDSYERVADAFRGYRPRGQHARMITLFLGLCEAAGIVEKAPEKSRTRSTSEPGQAQTRRPSPARKAAGSSAPKRAGGLHPALMGLLESLPPTGERWTKDERDRFLETFETVLDFAVPLREEEEIEGGVGDP